MQARSKDLPISSHIGMATETECEAACRRVATIRSHSTTGDPMNFSTCSLSRWTAALASLLIIAPAVQAAPPQFVAGEILIQPAAGLTDAKFAQILSRSNGRALRKLAGLGVSVVAAATAQSLEARRGSAGSSAPASQASPSRRPGAGRAAALSPGSGE